MLKFFRLNTVVRNSIADNLERIIADPTALAPYIITMTDTQARAFCEILFDAGLHAVYDTVEPTLLLLWNNQEDARIHFRYNDAYLYFGSIQSMNYDAGVVKRFAPIIPPAQRWSHGAQNEIVHRTQWQALIDYANIFSASDSQREDSP